MNWWRGLKGKIKQREPLKRHVTFKIGGPARFFIEPKDIADLKLLLALKKRYKIPILVIGRGSNLLVDSNGVNAVVIRLSSTAFRKLSFKGNIADAGSGVLLKDIVIESAQRGLSGLEFLSGIPGTLGGALAMNAGMGRHGPSIGDFVRQVKVMNYSGEIKELRDINFSYRNSGLKKYIILEASLGLEKSTKAVVSDKIMDYWKQRRLRQDASRPNAGCIFRNPGHDSAGRLIELCGLKGKKIGGSAVSLKHANFILNKNHARSADVLALMQLIKERVRGKFKVSLIPEIEIWK